MRAERRGLRADSSWQKGVRAAGWRAAGPARIHLYLLLFMILLCLKLRTGAPRSPRHFSAQSAAAAAAIKIPHSPAAKYRLSMSMGSSSRLPSPCVEKSATCYSNIPAANKNMSLPAAAPPSRTCGRGSSRSRPCSVSPRPASSPAGRRAAPPPLATSADGAGRGSCAGPTRWKRSCCEYFFRGIFLYCFYRSSTALKGIERPFLIASSSSYTFGQRPYIECFETDRRRHWQFHPPLAAVCC